MSRRQIRKLQRELEAAETSPDPQSVPVKARAKFSFADIACSDDDLGPEPSDNPNDSYETKSSHTAPAVKNNCPTRQDSSSSIDDEILDNLSLETAQENSQSDPDIKQSLLCSKPSDFWYPLHLLQEQHGTKARNSGYRPSRKFLKLSSRHWLIPITCMQELKGLQMEAKRQLSIEMETVQGRDCFMVKTSRFFREVASVCNVAIDSQDPSFFSRVMESHPFNLQVLTRASCIHTLGGSHEQAFKSISIAIGQLQSVLPPQFSPFKVGQANLPNVWLPSAYKDNLIVYRILVLYMIALERQAQWNAALAIGKLLLAMDIPTDVTHAIAHVDMYLVHVSSSSKRTTDILQVEEFAQEYSRHLDAKMPSLVWLLPNFAMALALEAYCKCTRANGRDPLDTDANELVESGELQKAFFISETSLGFKFVPDASSLSVKNPLLLLVRAMIQFPQVVEAMAQHVDTSLKIKQLATMEPFTILSDDLQTIQLAACYVTKCRDYWQSGDAAQFFAKGALLTTQIYAIPKGKQIIEAFRDLWIASCVDVKPLIDVNDIYTNEFDLGAYALPPQLERD